MTEKVNASEHEPKVPPSEGSIRLYAETNLPTEFGLFRVAVFLEESSQKEHLAIIRGEIQGKKNLLIRVHSECFTGEVLHSLKCDCKDQLHAALEQIRDEEEGMVIYLRQEGRGIGLGNKIRAYALQEQGHDTVDANRLLGFQDDLRTYETAVAILRHFQIASIRLLTNNPEKVENLRKLGVEVAKRVPIYCVPNSHNLLYFETKKQRMGHLFEADFLEEARESLAPSDADAIDTAHMPLPNEPIPLRPLHLSRSLKINGSAKA